MENPNLYIGRFSTEGCSFYPSQNLPPCKVEPPPPGVVKKNFDGSILNSSVTGGYVLRDWTGKHLKAGAANYGSTSIMVAEARALKDGVHAVIQAGYKRLLIEGDNSTVIQALASKSQVPWKIATIIDDIQIWLNHDFQLQVIHIYREANMVADWLANYGHSITNSISSYTWFSSEFRNILATDVVGRTLVRRGA